MKAQLRKIMKQVDLDEITSKSIRLQLEHDLKQNLEEFKSFIDEEILLILGQMDQASKVFDFLYLPFILKHILFHLHFALHTLHSSFSCASCSAWPELLQ